MKTNKQLREEFHKLWIKNIDAGYDDGEAEFLDLIEKSISQAVEEAEERAEKKFLDELLPFHNIVWQLVQSEEALMREVPYSIRKNRIDKDSLSDVRLGKILKAHKRNMDNLCKFENKFFQKEYKPKSK